MKKTFITLASIATLAVSANAQSIIYTDWETDNVNPVNGTLAGATGTINISVTSDQENPLGTPLDLQVGSGFGGQGFPGDAGLLADPDGNGVEFLNFRDINAATVRISFASPLQEDILFNATALDQDITISGGTFASFAGGSVSGNTFTNTSGDPANGGGFSVLIAAGTTEFGITTSAGGDNWHGTFSTVPEPSSTALLGLGGLALVLRRKK